MHYMAKTYLGTADYLVFAAVLAVSAFIGLFYAFKDRRNNSTKELLLGGRSMSVFPVAISMVSAMLSAVVLLGYPVEIYRYGTQFVMFICAFFLVVPATVYLYLPVFYNLGLTSAYQYLELRFSRSVRTLTSAISLLSMIFYIPVAMYAPALALSEVTGIGIWTSVLSVGLVCTFYTSIGGIKAVVWTDLFQALIMFSSLFVILIKGALDLGGFGEVWDINQRGQRIEFFVWDVDPFVRHTFWSVTFGSYFLWMTGYAGSQMAIQRYLAVGSLRGAQLCLWIHLPFLMLLIVLTCCCGLVIYAYYEHCDPIGAKIIAKADQLFPRYVMDTLGSYPGVPGIFISGIFSGCISTISSGINAMSAITLEDYVKPFIVKDISEEWATRLTKIFVIVYGFTSISLVYVAENVGSIVQISFVLLGSTPLCATFTMGMFFPYINTWGALSGIVAGMATGVWLAVGSLFYSPMVIERPMSYDTCPVQYFNATGKDPFDTTLSSVGVDQNEYIFPAYRLSYLWLGAVNMIVVIVVASVVSFITGLNKLENVDERLISPPILWLWKRLCCGKTEENDLTNSKDFQMSQSSIVTFGTDNPITGISDTKIK